MYVPPKIKPLCPPELPPRYEDVPYAQVALDDGRPYTLRLDIYQDPGQSLPGPCIVYIFGGGWMWGEYKQATQKAVYCRDLVRLTREGYTVVCPDYRLASQSVFPACIHDVKGAVRFLKANGERYHIDPERIGVLGNSAGGHLAAMLALSAGHPEIEGTVGGNLEFSSLVKAAALFYAPADLGDTIRTSAAAVKERDLTGTELEGASGSTADAIPALIVGYTGPGRTVTGLCEVLERDDPSDPDWRYIELTRLCSPITYVSAGCPPVAIFHGGRDSVVDPAQSEKLYHALVAAGADATLIEYSLGAHGPSLGGEVDRFAYEFLKSRL